MVPKPARMPAAMEAAMPMVWAICFSSKPSSLATVTADPKVPMVPLE